MSALGAVTSTGTLAPEVIDRRVGRVPEQIVQAWREHGTGYPGSDGFVRLLDPDHADEMLEIGPTGGVGDLLGQRSALDDPATDSFRGSAVAPQGEP